MNSFISLARHRWEASAALKKKLATLGIPLDGAPGGWSEVYRVYKECKVWHFLRSFWLDIDVFCSLLKMKAMSFSSRMPKDLLKCDPSSVTAQSATPV
jgi:hypothetical protein